MHRASLRCLFPVFLAALSHFNLFHAAAEEPGAKSGRPNIIFIMTDDHAAHALSCYGSKVNTTPNLDRIPNEGMRLTNCFVTNALCAPSRAAILTSKYSHLNKVKTHRGEPFDGSQMTFPKLFQKAGYQTAVVGKWHLKSDPTGFDYWNILPGQGAYHNPAMIEMGERKKHQGYATDLITDFSIEYLKNRDKDKPFLLLYHHKAPHRPWQPDEKHAEMFEDRTIPVPPTFNDDYWSRSAAAHEAKMRIREDLSVTDTKTTPPDDLDPVALKHWKYQRYMQDYLRCVASVDDNVGRMLDYLEESGLAENTIVIYTSDQGFFLGDHGWYDKRFMYEESLRTPFLIRYPGKIEPGSTSDEFVMNIDFAPTMLDLAGIEPPDEMQGKSFREILTGGKPASWRDAIYYHYYEYPDADHMVHPHYGVRTSRFKLMRFYDGMDEWELYDLKQDPHEITNVYSDPAYADTVKELKAELVRLRSEYGDTDGPAL